MDIGRRRLELSVSTGSIADTRVRSSNAAIDDNDFGEIRIAETDAMPQSKEVLECQRTTVALTDILARLRLRGAALSSKLNQPMQDPQLINAFLTAEGSKMMQVGTVICSAIKAGHLRLSLEAVNLVLGSFEEMLSSYAYSRDERVLCLALSFMSCSTPYWLGAEQASSSSDLSERTIYLAKFLALKSAREQIPAWRVRLAILMFVDEYIDFDPSFAVWTNLEMDDLNNTDDTWGPLAVISGGLVDRDARIRFRAATSTAGLFYLQSIRTAQICPFYEATLNSLPRQPGHWDSFITDILWKLNCCVTSAQLRAATIYHLYEVPLSSSEFNYHLQVGLQAVAYRLGLDGIASLYLPHAALIIRSQLGVNQSPMRVPYRVCGSASHKAFASSVLDSVAPSILAAIHGETMDQDGKRGLPGARQLFMSLCEAVGMPPQAMVIRHYSATLALIQANLVDAPSYPQEKALSSSVYEALTALPGLETAVEIEALFQRSLEPTSACIFGLMNLEGTTEEIAAFLDDTATESQLGSIFSALMENDVICAESQSALYPSFSLKDVLSAYTAICNAQPSISASKTVFATLISLFGRANSTFLISEQRRYLRSIALMTALHEKEYSHPAILQLFLQEISTLLDRRDVCFIALSFMKWGFEQISRTSSPLRDLADIILRIGTAWSRLSQVDSYGSKVALEIERWLLAMLPSWQKIKAMRDAIGVALALWPSQLAQHIRGWPDPTFGDLCDLAGKLTMDDSEPLLESMLAKLPEGDLHANIRAFQQRAFWYFKKAIPSATSKGERGLLAFLDILYSAEGQLHAPSLEAIKFLVSDASFDKLVVRFRKEPFVSIQAVIVDLAMRLTTNEDYRVRTTAYQVLQSILCRIEGIHSHGILSPEAVEVMSLMVPIEAVPRLAGKDHIITIVDDEILVRQSTNLRIWATCLAHQLCDVLSEDDPFYSGITPLISTTETSASDLLPFLVQAFLSGSCSSDGGDLLTDRVRTLSNHFATVLRHPSVALDTTRAIVKIELHLRHFDPPHQADFLGHNSWLDIDHLLLSEASISCGAFATALLFLESTTLSGSSKSQIDLYDPRIQKVSIRNMRLYS